MVHIATIFLLLILTPAVSVSAEAGWWRDDFHTIDEETVAEAVSSIAEVTEEQENRLTGLEEDIGTSRLVHPRMAHSLPIKRVREAFEVLVKLITDIKYGPNPQGHLYGVVRNELYDILLAYHELPPATEPERGSIIRRIKDAGLINNLYAYAHKYYTDLVK